MRFEIAIEYSPEMMEASRRRLEARTRFAIVDRVQNSEGDPGAGVRDAHVTAFRQ